MSFTLQDSPNDRVLNLLQSFEPLLVNYLKTNPEDKELAEKALGNLRKALAGEYNKLPEPKVKKEAPQPEPPSQSSQINWYQWAQQAQMPQQQMSQLNSNTQWRWPWEE